MGAEQWKLQAVAAAWSQGYFNCNENKSWFCPWIHQYVGKPQSCQIPSSRASGPCSVSHMAEPGGKEISELLCLLANREHQLEIKRRKRLRLENLFSWSLPQDLETDQPPAPKLLSKRPVSLPPGLAFPADKVTPSSKLCRVTLCPRSALPTLP